MQLWSLIDISIPCKPPVKSTLNLFSAWQHEATVGNTLRNVITTNGIELLVSDGDHGLRGIEAIVDATVAEE